MALLPRPSSTLPKLPSDAVRLLISIAGEADSVGGGAFAIGSQVVKCLPLWEHFGVECIVSRHLDGRGPEC
jgi:hypothetical protein